jgi:hypothetical protein
MYLDRSFTHHCTRDGIKTLLGGNRFSAIQNVCEHFLKKIHIAEWCKYPWRVIFSGDKNVAILNVPTEEIKVMQIDAALAFIRKAEGKQDERCD